MPKPPRLKKPLTLAQIVAYAEQHWTLALGGSNGDRAYWDTIAALMRRK